MLFAPSFAVGLAVPLLISIPPQDQRQAETIKRGLDQVLRGFKLSAPPFWHHVAFARNRRPPEGQQWPNKVKTPFGAEIYVQGEGELVKTPRGALLRFPGRTENQQLFMDLRLVRDLQGEYTNCTVSTDNSGATLAVYGPMGGCAVYRFNREGNLRWSKTLTGVPEPNMGHLGPAKQVIWLVKSDTAKHVGVFAWTMHGACVRVVDDQHGTLVFGATWNR